jgi:hypothetical protein
VQIVKISVFYGRAMKFVCPMFIKEVFMKKTIISLLLTCALFITGCSGGSYSRGIFEGQVNGQTEAEVIKRVGEPDTIDSSNAASHKFFYKGRTFDTNASGQKDVEAVITFEKDKDGKYVATGVYFS